MRSLFSVVAALLMAALLAGVPAAAEEFYLKDGTKLVGKIIGYEEGKDAFRVETSFGIAIIYKDRIARIVFSETAGEKIGPPQPDSSPAAARKQGQPAEPQAIRAKEIVEHVTGTRYINETYRFHLFKPPTWRSYPQLVKPDTPLVTALGTPDETTLMLIGQEGFNGDLESYARLAEQSLRRTYEDYRPQGERRTTIAGLPAVERSFTGEAEGRFWTGLALYFARGRRYYTVLGLTSAGEITSFQESVLRKVMDSLTFYE